MGFCCIVYFLYIAFIVFFTIMLSIALFKTNFVIFQRIVLIINGNLIISTLVAPLTLDKSNTLGRFVLAICLLAIAMFVIVVESVVGVNLNLDSIECFLSAVLSIVMLLLMLLVGRIFAIPYLYGDSLYLVTAGVPSSPIESLSFTRKYGDISSVTVNGNTYDLSNKDEVFVINKNTDLYKDCIVKIETGNKYDFGFDIFRATEREYNAVHIYVDNGTYSIMMGGSDYEFVVK